MKKLRSHVHWALAWRSQRGNEYIIYDSTTGLPALFPTRRLARRFRDERYGYIKHREDLRREPYGWRLPVPFRVQVIEAGGRGNP
jgi:hypothetical protein